MINKKLIVGIALAAILGTVGCSSNSYDREETRPAPGHYQHTSSYIDDNGARVENQESTEITEKNNCRRDSRHHCRRHVSKKSKTTVDPKGLFNKKTTHESNEESDQK
ncbi:MAG: hypothetical protein K2Q32_02125 [Alphaproteobacteria bacterium]|nr:hypothetical protein [Alphaproteobacteria bacterium]